MSRRRGRRARGVVDIRQVWGAALAVAVGFRATFLAVGLLLLALAVLVARGVPIEGGESAGRQVGKGRTSR
jgi:predicted MFS family arabinose efflux permease